MENYSQVCVWPGMEIGDDQKIIFEQWLKQEFDVRGIYCEEVLTRATKDGDGGRNDLFFRVHEDDIMKFATKRLGYGIRWWEDVLLNGGAPLYPSNIQQRYPKTW